MDTRSPHDIVPETKIPPPGDPRRERWLPLTDEQARELSGVPEEARHAWLKEHVPARERLTRHLAAIGLPVLASLANAGAFCGLREPGTKQGLLYQLHKAKRGASRRKGEHHEKVREIADLEKLVAAGEYDDAEGQP